MTIIQRLLEQQPVLIITEIKVAPYQQKWKDEENGTNRA